MTLLLSFLVAVAIALVLTYPLRLLALRFGIMDRPGPRKGHAEPVPYLGGLAIFAGAAVSISVFQPAEWDILALLGLVALIGLVDDVRYLPVWIKLIGEVAIAASAVALGFSWNVTDSPELNGGLAIIWIVGLTNSFNLLDNMDGLASTAAACALVALALIVPSSAGLALPLAGATVGFWFVNRPQARMFMGDAGSLMLGFGVALCSIGAADTERGLHSLVILAFPLALAIFDTSLVIASRLATGRPIQLGGQDHFSHRLRLLGWSPYQILAAAVAGSFTGAACASLALSFPNPQAWLALPLGVIFVAAWAGLLRVDPYVVGAHPQVEVVREQRRG
ncbi:MAG: undecaprenyl/decaprenyl-phosphate alpha-N-acetylglucosaminyl 1-phosphate transferase [Chloroflexi bacterium]|nr:MAG: undecaprenyl/decaprenyl-phosphate alpha-N-acetylglucosaminyl 1-phosphate transferase [Chloroflexota bacterium]TMF81409.1 MAG: undecaprenyl/decaprenyl-phosphate alpha-N-acetylglucosaminyl 1-phosphate transferase [Chloroflexota bacterium]TMG61375.1 MAG: undecaprenyl/decaprenyl-phosphate alpha-N-acetylglucosaminyl 1-phosphate transferase [Chloroflexota bacterium]